MSLDIKTEKQPTHNKYHKAQTFNTKKRSKKNRTIKHYKNNKRVKKQTSIINDTIEKYGTIEKLINSINECNELAELAIIINVYNDKYYDECGDDIFNEISKKITHQEAVINNNKSIFYNNRNILNTM